MCYSPKRSNILERKLTLLSWYSTVSHAPVAEVLGRTSFFNDSPRCLQRMWSSPLLLAGKLCSRAPFFCQHMQGQKWTVFFYGYKWLSFVFQNNHPHYLQFSGHAWSWNMWYHQRSFAMNGNNIILTDCRNQMAMITNMYNHQNHHHRDAVCEHPRTNRFFT